METQYLNPFTLAFASRQTENQYWQHRQGRLRAHSVLAVGIVLVLYPIFGVLDPFIIPEVVKPVWVIRVLVTIQCVVLILLTRTALFSRFHQALLASLPLFGGLGILLMLALAGETGTQLYYAALILAIIWTLLFADLRFIYALPICLALIIGYEIIALYLNPLPMILLASNNFFIFGALAMAAPAGFTIERYNRINFYQSLLLEQEQQRSEKLLLNILPPDITKILKSRPGTIAERHDQASILFADIVGFTPLSAQMVPEEMVDLLNETFSFFDTLVEKYGLEKIRTIGDNYMVASGVPRRRADHAHALARMALEMLEYTNRVPAGSPHRLQFRIGINSGPVVAGVIGRKKFQYDVWGDTVNIASRMESQGVPGQIQVTRATYELLKDEFIFVPRGSTTVKGIGMMETWLLVGTRRELQRKQAWLPYPPEQILLSAIPALSETSVL